MSTVFTPKPMRISVEKYQKMVSTGVLTKHDRVELIEGEILERAPIGTRHFAFTARLIHLLVTAVGRHAIVSPGGPVDLGAWSEPEPDLMLLRPRTDFYIGAHPVAQDVLLLIEVCDSSLGFDRTTKRALYARFRIGEYWIVNIPDRTLEVHRSPGEQGYAERMELRSGETIAPQALPAAKLALAELFDPLSQ